VVVVWLCNICGMVVVVVCEHLHEHLQILDLTK
jgi:hypothetical protein